MPVNDFMRDLEDRYREASGLTSRAQYKIFFSPVRPAPILTLGINPGGDPKSIEPDGLGTGASDSGRGYYDDNTHDLLDCEWPENTGLRKLLVPLLDGSREKIRDQVVKTNMAFRRSLSTKRKHIDIDAAKAEAAPFLDEIIAEVRPQLILLTGVGLTDFAARYSRASQVLVEPVRADGLQHIVFGAARLTLRSIEHDVIAVQVAHASQFSWTYERYSVAERIRALQEFGG